MLKGQQRIDELPVFIGHVTFMVSLFMRQCYLPVLVVFGSSTVYSTIQGIFKWALREAQVDVAPKISTLLLVASIVLEDKI